MHVARITRWLPILAFAAALAGCGGGSGPTAAEIRCQNDKREVREYSHEAQEGIAVARETGNASMGEVAAQRGLEAAEAQIHDCR